jgi:stage II sporulation protein D
MPRPCRSLLLPLLAGAAAFLGPSLGVGPASAPVDAAPLVSGALRQPEPQVRVLLFEGPALSLAADDAAGLRVRDRQGRRLRDVAGPVPVQVAVRGAVAELRLPLQPSQVLPTSRTQPTVEASGLLPQAQSARAVPSASPSPGPSRPALSSPEQPLSASELWIEPLAPGGDGASLTVQQRRFRGRLQLVARSGTLQVINHVPLETYLASVVGSEMPATWPQQALRAQAVAARTYALKGLRPQAPFDLKATVASQVYRGIEAETPSTRAAVVATRGLVLTFDSGLIDAVFHSSSGGNTESSGDLWPRQLPYLVSVPDFDHDSPVRQWRQPLAAELLARAFIDIGGVRSIEVLSTTPTGRVRQARVVGPSGQLVLSGPALRNRLGLKSTWVRFELELPPPDAAGPVLPAPPPPLPAFSLPATAFEPPAAAAAAVSLPLPQWVAVGRGFGHGIGMSQWGAYAMARRGDSFDEILSH